MTYANGEFLHHYLTIKNTMTEVIRGDQQRAIGEFYALLLHTSSTQAGFEFAIRPWGDRNFEDNLAPHGWFAAEYRTLLRTMLIREAGPELHLLSAVSPDWIGRGKVVAVRQAPTSFGPIAFRLDQPSDTEAVLRIDAAFTAPPRQIVIHIPWFVTLRSATADGQPVRAIGGVVAVSPHTRVVRLEWVRKPGATMMSYQGAVRAYEAEYARHYQILMHGEAAAKN